MYDLAYDDFYFRNYKMEPNNYEGYPPPRVHHAQANGTVPRPSSQIRQLVDPYGASMAGVGAGGGGPPPAYNEQLQMGNGSVGVSSSSSHGGGGGRDRESGDFNMPNPPQQQQLSSSTFSSSSGGGGLGGHTNQGQQQPPPPSRTHHKDRGDSSLQRSNSLENALPKILKVAVIGDSTVGKTCICQALTQDHYNFNKNYHLTCGVNIYTKGIKLPEERDVQVNLVMVDSSGKDIYTDTLPKYWGKLDGVVVVLDMSSASSLQNAGQWLYLAQKCIKTSSSGPPGDSTASKIVGILLGNKMDIPTERRPVSAKQAQEFAAKHHLKYFECSVKENSGLEEPFLYLAQAWMAGLLGLPSPFPGQGLPTTAANYDKENVPSSN